MFSKLATSPEIYSAAVNRYEEYNDQGFPGLDSELIYITKLLNKIEGVCTIWSCASHPEKFEQDITWDTKLDPDFYVTCATNTIGIGHLVSLFAIVSKKSETGITKRIAHTVDLVFSKLDGKVAFNTDCFYNTVSFNAYLDSSEVKKAFLKILEESIKEYRESIQMVEFT